MDKEYNNKKDNKKKAGEKAKNNAKGRAEERAEDRDSGTESQPDGNAMSNEDKALLNDLQNRAKRVKARSKAEQARAEKEQKQAKAEQARVKEEEAQTKEDLGRAGKETRADTKKAQSSPGEAQQPGAGEDRPGEREVEGVEAVEEERAAERTAPEKEPSAEKEVAAKKDAAAENKYENKYENEEDEEAVEEEHDRNWPGTEEPPFPIVAIGASAGGLDPLKVFFSQMPSHEKIAFVVIQHLDPKHKSYMSDLIQKYTGMRVMEVEDGVTIKPGIIYLGPPDKLVDLFHGRVQLIDMPKSMGGSGVHLPIDHFFRSLAKDCGERSVGIILSGTGTDGTIGLKAIKGSAGMVMTQDPGQAQYSGMPHSAISTGIVDFILPVEKMPQELLQYLKHPYVKSPQAIEAEEEKQFEDHLQKIFMIIRSRTGHDFSNYKQNTIRRRIERRMAVHKIVEIRNYVRLLHEDSDEVQNLFKDLLIKVTSFFRDADAFETLSERVIHTLLEEKRDQTAIRVWVPGCASGEEAYSLAMLFIEEMEELKKEWPVQIFASDIDKEAIDQGRAARYPDNITADVSESRLKRFFLKDDGMYKIKKQIRQMVVFAVQNVLTDPPFTKLDLISCRNLLIYMESSLQKKILPLFHYALNPDGYLFLGTSESIGESHDLFKQVDKKWKIYQHRGNGAVNVADYPPFSISMPVYREINRNGKEKGIIRKPSLRDLIERITLKEYAPPSVIIDEDFNILYFQGSTDRYLTLPVGEPNLNILNMARLGLSHHLKNMIIKAVRQNDPVTSEGIHVKDDGEYRKIDLVVRNISDAAEIKRLFMVVFIDKPVESAAVCKPPKGKRGRKAEEADPRMIALEEKLRTTREELQSTIEELETSNEELKSANEELQSSNEEAQSTNEELETSREELQSTNEELATVNTELQNKVNELSKASDDINNLLASTDIATMFLDKELRIRRFTPAMTEIFNLITGDIGRPISDITSRISSFDIAQSAKEVLRSLQHMEKQEQTENGNWFSIRIRPYRTMDNVIDGVVLSFVDITEMKKSEHVAQASKGYAESIVNAVRELLVILDEDFKIVSANQAFYRIMKTYPQRIEGASIFDFAGEQSDMQKLKGLLDKVVNDNQPFNDFEITFTGPDTNRMTLLLNARAIHQEIGKPQRILLALEDITEKKRREVAKYREIYKAGEMPEAGELTDSMNKDEGKEKDASKEIDKNKEMK
ncbi:MAG: CheR family methyltransferase [bacterium]